MQNEYSLHFALALWSVILGAFLCSVYDIFRLFRLNKRQNNVVLFINDISFCLIATLCFMLLFFNLSHGRMRAYAFVLAVVGFLIWRFTVSYVVMNVMQRLFDFVSRCLNSAKMRACKALALLSRRIYTRFYCRRSISAVYKLALKRKEDNNGKETDTQ